MGNVGQHGIRGFRRRLPETMLSWLVVALLSARPSVGVEIAPAEPFAEVNGEAIAAEEVIRRLGMKLSQLEEQIYNLKRQELDSLIADKLLAQEAAKRGVSVTSLLDTEVTPKIDPVTEQEVQEFFLKNKSLMTADEAGFRQNIREFLGQRKFAAQRQIFIESLRSEAQVVIHLSPPTLVRFNVPDAGPVRGAPDAKVTIIEFSDFQCPFCKQAHSTLSKLLEHYLGKVKLVYRDFPVDKIHRQARLTAIAARCANDQGKFWEYHDLVFTESPKLSRADLKRYAHRIGLDAAKFEACLSSQAHNAAVQKDLEEGKKLGVTSTPAFFINGRPLAGAQSVDAFARIIDEELARSNNLTVDPK